MIYPADIHIVFDKFPVNVLDSAARDCHDGRDKRLDRDENWRQ